MSVLFPWLSIILSGMIWLPIYFIELIFLFLAFRYINKSYLLISMACLNLVISSYIFYINYRLYSHPGTGLFDFYNSPEDLIVSIIIAVYTFIILMSSYYIAILIRRVFKLPFKKARAKLAIQ